MNERVGLRREPTYLVLRTSEDATDLAERCARWAHQTGAAVEVVGPVDSAAVRARLASGRYVGAVLEIAEGMNDQTLASTIAHAGLPVVAVSRRGLTKEHSAVATACSKVFAGRGTGGFLWALWHLHALHEHPPRTLPYGSHSAHRGDLRLPHGAARHAIVTLIHGGFWRHEWERDLMDGLALDLTRRGYATWNVEYRRSGPTGGGWPQTADDVSQAIAFLTTLADRGIDLDRLVLLGHSAGAQLMLRAAGALHGHSPPTTLVVAMSGLFDLATAARHGVGWGSIEAFLDAGPDDDPARYRDAAPIDQLPLRVPQLLVHGTADRHVPYAQSAIYRERASAAGDQVELAALEGADHFSVVDPTSEAWTITVAALEHRVPPS